MHYETQSGTVFSLESYQYEYDISMCEQQTHYTRLITRESDKQSKMLRKWCVCAHNVSTCTRVHYVYILISSSAAASPCADVSSRCACAQQLNINSGAGAILQRKYVR